MLFNTVEFIIFFCVVLAVISIIKHRAFQHLFLLGASYFFLYFSNNYLISLLIVSTVLDYYIGKEIWKTNNQNRKKLLLIISLIGNLGLLGFFKYSDFAILQFNILGNYFNLGSNIPYLEWILPVGISFYTFQTISWTVDIYRGKLEPNYSFWQFALFVAFFTQLVAGPIVRAREFLPQLKEKVNNVQTNDLRLIIIHNSNLKLGITLMVFGFLKKMFFSDNIAPLVNEVFSHPVGLDSFSIIIATIGFGLQIYGDFSGYTDIAIGASLILGIKLPINFNKPYFATSPIDFWRRWHISLSSWLRDYLYIPLGGNKKSKERTYLNLFAVMFLGGLWHGASWNFVIWGVLHGSYLAIQKIIIDRIPGLKDNTFFKTKIGKIISILITQYLVFLAWIPFRVQDGEQAIYAMQKFIFIDLQFDGALSFISQHKFPIGIMILFIILHFISYMKPGLVKKISELKLRYWGIVLTIILSIIVFFYNGNPQDFIYFKF